MRKPVAWLLASTWCAALAAGAAPAVPRGLFCTTNTCNWVLKNGKRTDLFVYPVDGVLNYVAWRAVEPESGKFRWPGLDRMTREAAAQDKKLAYHVLAGTHAPDWLFARSGVEKFEVIRRGKRRRTYLPWMTQDGRRVVNARVLDAWRRVVRALSERLHRPDCRSRVWYVAITGWPESNGLELMWAANDYAEFRKLRWKDGGEALYEEFCKRVIDLYLDAFPDMPLGLAFTDWFGRLPDGRPRRDARVSERIVTYALREAKRRGATVVPMGLWMGNAYIIHRPQHPLTRLMTKLRRDAPGIAFEGPMGSFKGYAPLREQLEFARRMGASWVQLWHHDVIHDEYQPLLREFRSSFHAARR